jgi:hypothetical protein
LKNGRCKKNKKKSRLIKNMAPLEVLNKNAVNKLTKEAIIAKIEKAKIPGMPKRNENKPVWVDFYLDTVAEQQAAKAKKASPAKAAPASPRGRGRSPAAKAAPASPRGRGRSPAAKAAPAGRGRSPAAKAAPPRRSVSKTLMSTDDSSYVDEDEVAPKASKFSMGEDNFDGCVAYSDGNEKSHVEVEAKRDGRVVNFYAVFENDGVVPKRGKSVSEYLTELFPDMMGNAILDAFNALAAGGGKGAKEVNKKVQEYRDAHPFDKKDEKARAKVNEEIEKIKYKFDPEYRKIQDHIKKNPKESKAARAEAIKKIKEEFAKTDATGERGALNAALEKSIQEAYNDVNKAIFKAGGGKTDWASATAYLTTKLDSFKIDLAKDEFFGYFRDTKAARPVKVNIDVQPRKPQTKVILASDNVINNDKIRNIIRGKEHLGAILDPKDRQKILGYEGELNCQKLFEIVNRELKNDDFIAMYLDISGERPARERSRKSSTKKEVPSDEFLASFSSIDEEEDELEGLQEKVKFWTDAVKDAEAENKRGGKGGSRLADAKGKLAQARANLKAYHDSLKADELEAAALRKEAEALRKGKGKVDIASLPPPVKKGEIAHQRRGQSAAPAGRRPSKLVNIV